MDYKKTYRDVRKRITTKHIQSSDLFGSFLGIK